MILFDSISEKEKTVIDLEKDILAIREPDWVTKMVVVIKRIHENEREHLDGFEIYFVENELKLYFIDWIKVKIYPWHLIEGIILNYDYSVVEVVMAFVYFDLNYDIDFDWKSNHFRGIHFSQIWNRVNNLITTLCLV